MAVSKYQSNGRNNLLRPPGARKAPITRLPLNAQVAERLRSMIVSGELEEDKKVPFAELSDKLGVSLTPIREAMKILAEEQLVELTPNRGARVLPVTVEEMKSLFEVIAEIEALAARLAATRMTDDELQQLEDMHAEMRGFFESRDRAQYFSLNNSVHARIVEFSHNPVLIHTHKKMTVRSARGRFIAVLDEGRWEQAMQEHENVMAAFRDRDAARASDIWRVHLQRSGEVTARVLLSRQQE
jgi:DNA-binding GntR family transcriptional regulator